ncbi:NUMOD4 motif-containing HNH endonuclease [Urbifossiella limnaea]|uniref:NUMOD4 motif protein n=1 Tax=Urbifossiella limnaea TaxID=2528023 RepID=A0A517XSS8_9BACT|nr:NUMOD4 motif-containing HNH endonuclease [Urbifossiella limnaea]QDU20570.1 NUMOD4 motif protein [Urbifossiella limnaea]
MTSNEEEWKSIPGFPGYEASSFGRIRNTRRNHILDGTTTHKGYKQVNVRGERGRRSAAVHRLVALAFLGPPPSRYVCHHINAVKDDNRPQNLVWLTIGQNVRLAHQMRLVPFDHMKGERNPAAKLTDDRVRAMRAQGRAGETSVALAAAFGVSVRSVDKVLARQAWKHVE